MTRQVFINDDFINEEEASLPYRDLAIQRGYGVFDFFRLLEGKPVFLADHLQRFYYSAEQMRLKVFYQKEELAVIIDTLIKKNQVRDGGIRITLTGGFSPDGYLLTGSNLVVAHHSFMPPADDLTVKGIKLITYEFQRQLPRVKTIDYIMAIWLQPLLQQHMAEDVLYHQDGYVTECPRSNFFILTRDETLVTPSEHLLKGITRLKLIEAVKGQFRVEERPLHISEIQNAKEAFITSTSKMILPVRQLNDHFFPQVNVLAQKLKEVLKKKVEDLVIEK